MLAQEIRLGSPDKFFSHGRSGGETVDACLQVFNVISCMYVHPLTVNRQACLCVPQLVDFVENVLCMYCQSLLNPAKLTMELVLYTTELHQSMVWFQCTLTGKYRQACVCIHTCTDVCAHTHAHSLTSFLLPSFYSVYYRSVPQIRPPSRISPPCIFNAKSCRGTFIPRISPPPTPTMHGCYQNLLSSQRCLLLVETPTQSGSRSRWWNSSARTKPASTEPLNISRSIASVLASGVKSTVC